MLTNTINHICIFGHRQISRRIVQIRKDFGSMKLTNPYWYKRQASFFVHLAAFSTESLFHNMASVLLIMPQPHRPILKNVSVPIANCICLNCKLYLSRLQNIFVCTICHNIASVLLTMVHQHLPIQLNPDIGSI